mmetsp:Transcript_16606/g.24542  ORF Transcript_16606/g.24542 Transcript_16606/m.24542 type:complete len:113 (-) Transcript_16606:60-398(-)
MNIPQMWLCSVLELLIVEFYQVEVIWVCILLLPLKQLPSYRCRARRRLIIAILVIGNERDFYKCCHDEQKEETPKMQSPLFQFVVGFFLWFRNKRQEEGWHGWLHVSLYLKK